MSRLAPDRLTIIIDEAAVTLRPTLRAAYRLNEKHHGFEALALAIMAGDLAAMADVIEEAADRPTAIVDLLRDLAVNGNDRLAVLREPLLDYLAQLVGSDLRAATDEGNATSTSSAKTITRTEYLDQLFEIGTGWLNWTPAETWAAAPAEIEAAHRGRINLLKAIFGEGGSGSKGREDRSTLPFSDRVKATMAALGGKIVKRQKPAGG